ncbi:potassium channel family protein [Actinopolymorpha sp. B17G11]|uniref:potassium channel family protein n=1 Tax=Actinopolymorpha sp. B17G11 TaxID=3160861 RepID=UPI0032E48247
MDPGSDSSPPDRPDGRAALRRRVVAFSWLLIGLLVAYALIIATSGRLLGSVARILALAVVLFAALRIRHVSRGRTDAVGVIAVAAVVMTATASVFAGGELLAVLTAATTIILVAVAGSLVIHSLMANARVDLATVLGVLCIYLLIALVFSSAHELGGAFLTGYFEGAHRPPTAGDCLYYSVITITTVGIGDISPGTNLARMVTVLEALVGQLYIVSVVAAVVGRWRRGTSNGGA